MCGDLKLKCKLEWPYTQQWKLNQQIISVKKINLSNWGRHERAPHLWKGVPVIYVCMYVCIVFLSVNNCSRVLIHWTASILQCVIQFPKCHQVQMYFNFACAMTTTTWLNSTCKPSCLSLYTRLHEYCKSPSSLCYLCRSWIIHCVGLRQTNASIANV